jgi:hypothetical protein
VTDPKSWLSAEGAERRGAAADAADLLLNTYRRCWAGLVPIELHRLAYTLDVQIKRVREVDGGARLIPVRGGFRVIVGHNLPRAKYRMAVAHELSHTLFYSRAAEMPEQLIECTDQEEHFCFDVARRILAPAWLIDAANLDRESDPQVVFCQLTNRKGAFQVSQPVAARLMLADYELATGIGSRWMNTAEGWSPQKSGASASPKLNPNNRKYLWAAARHWLNCGVELQGYRVFGQTDRDGTSAFVVATRRR